MKDEMDIQPPVNPHDTSLDNPKPSVPVKPTSVTETFDKSTFNKALVPHYKDLHAAQPSGATTKELASFYTEHLESLLGFPWELAEQTRKVAPTLPAPFLTGDKNGVISAEQFAVGVYNNVPRSPKIWVGDQLKMRWGNSTFYTTVGQSKSRNGPRLVQFLNAEKLGNYRTGQVEISYEVVRRTRLIGVSETLKVMVHSDGNQSRPIRGQQIRRRKLKE